MKGSENFKNVISAHLDKIAAADPVFAKKLDNPDKPIENCIQYILSEVHKSGGGGFSDSEIFGMAIHFYDEENIVVDKNDFKGAGSIVVNHHVELTEQEKIDAKNKAIEQLVLENKQRMTKKSTPAPASKPEDKQVFEQGSLF